MACETLGNKEKLSNEEIVRRIDFHLNEFRNQIAQLQEYSSESVKLKNEIEILENKIDRLWFKVCIKCALYDRNSNIDFDIPQLSSTLRILFGEIENSSLNSTEESEALFFLHRFNYIYQFKKQSKNITAFELFHLNLAETDDKNLDYTVFQETFFDNFDNNIKYEDFNSIEQEDRNLILKVVGDTEFKYKIKRMVDEISQYEDRIKECIFLNQCHVTFSHITLTHLSQPTPLALKFSNSPMVDFRALSKR